MFDVLLAGPYPAGTLEKLQKAVAGTDISIRAVTTEEQFAKENDVDAIILRIIKMPKEVIQRFSPRLKMIMRWGVGYDAVDVLMLAVGRCLLCHELELRNGVWSREMFTAQSRSLNHKVVGLVGGGNIGRQVARKVQAFGARVQYYDPFRLKPEMEKEFNLEYVDYATLLATSDVISYHVPLLDSTRHMLNKENIKTVKPGAIIINTSRSGIVEDAAIVEARKAGLISGAGLDCTEESPITKENPLLKDPHIIVTPHVGGTANDIGDSIIPMIVENLKLMAEGKALKFVVNKKAK